MSTNEKTYTTPASWQHGRQHTWPVLNVQEIRAVEELAFKQRTSFELMQEAGIKSAEKILSILKQEKHPEHPDVIHFLVLAGPGNNGGDALIVAGHLKQLGRTVHLYLVEPTHHESQDRQQAKTWCFQQGVQPNSDQQYPHNIPLVVIDGLLGIGCNRPPSGRIADFILQVKRHREILKIVALDVPSGLNSDTGQSFDCALNAHLTLSYIACKPGLITNEGKDYCGQILVESLGCEALIQPTTLALNDQTISSFLPNRTHASHKGSYGSVGIIGGAQGMTGACLLAARSAISLGSGRVAYTLLSEQPKNNLESYSARPPQTPADTQPNPAGFTDFLFPELMNKSLQENLEFATALTIGTGLGESAQAKNLLLHILQNPPTCPMVFDADALNLLAHHSELTKTLQAQQQAQKLPPLIFTPHPLEAARLLHIGTDQIQANRLKCASQMSEQFNCITILKGAGTIIATPHGQRFINLTGSAMLATAGSGDVLTGCIAAMLAQGLSPLQASQAAVWLHGVACDPLPHEHHAPLICHASDLITRMAAHLNIILRQRLLHTQNL